MPTFTCPWSATTRVAIVCFPVALYRADASVQPPKVGEMDTGQLFREWFQAFAQNAGITLHIQNLSPARTTTTSPRLVIRVWREPCVRL